MKQNKEEKFCGECCWFYGGQPYGYFPFICVLGKKSKEMWHEVFKCKHFEACPEFPERLKMEPWNVIVNRKCHKA